MSFFDYLVKHGMPWVPKAIVSRVASRYVAGESIDDAVRTLRKMNGEGAMGTVDVLGEEVRERSKTERAVSQYLDLLDRIETEGLNANISIKPTMLGLKIDEDLCADNVRTVVDRAAELGSFVRIDMEDHTCTDATLRLYRRKDFETIRANFIYNMEKLLAEGAYVGIATHDPHLVWAGMAAVDRLQIDRDRYEFQMLLGVDPELRSIILSAGHRLRVYVPYGRDWYPYSMRRLRENPTIAHHVVRAMLAR
jgi:proline dehydrogenase